MVHLQYYDIMIESWIQLCPYLKPPHSTNNWAKRPIPIETSAVTMSIIQIKLEFSFSNDITNMHFVIFVAMIWDPKSAMI